MTTLLAATWTRDDLRYDNGRTAERYFTNIVSHGLRDAKGREIGGYATVQRYEKTATSSWHGYAVEVHATRDGNRFGALPGSTLVPFGDDDAKALAAAQALGIRKLQEQAKRYAKAVAKGEGKQFARR